MDRLVELNQPSYQYYKACFLTFLDIYAPLISLGINFFGYIKLFNDGSYLSFATNEEFMKNYFINVQSQGITSTLQIETTLLKENRHFMFSHSITSFDYNKDALMHLFYKHHIWPIYAIYKNNKEYIEIYSFKTDLLSEYFEKFFLDTKILLEHFCLYFNERASDLINADDRKKRAWFQQQFNFSTLSYEDKWAQQAEQFLLETRLQHLSLQENNQKIIFSRREMECLQYLALGKSAKEIARDLSISPRTVEFYLQNTRKKSGLKKEQLFTHLGNYFPSN